MVTAQTILEARELHYTYPDGSQALNGVDFRAERGKLTALLGSNGAGKSSLLLACNGIVRPQSGTVLFRGVPVSYSRKGLAMLRRQVGMVFQNPDVQLFSSSVFQDISFGLCNEGLPEDEIRKRVAVAMRNTGIEALEGKPVHRLSFGQKKRVAMAGVLAMEPALLLLDEPTAGLDPKGAAEIMQLVKAMQWQSGMSVIIATHDIEMVPLFCDHVCVMEAGRVLFEGSPEEVFTRRDKVRQAGLRLPRIGHLMEILKEKDGFRFSEEAFSIGSARRAIKEWGRER